MSAATVPDTASPEITIAAPMEILNVQDDNVQDDHSNEDSADDSDSISESSVNFATPVPVPYTWVEHDPKRFSASTNTFPMGVDEDRWMSNTITVRERAMLWFMNEITDKPEWWRKVNDDAVVAKWKAELDGFVAKGGDPFEAGFTDNMFQFCLQELRDKSKIYDTTAIDKTCTAGGIVSIFDTAAAVFKADDRVPASVVEALRDAVTKFEDLPEDEKDWHPGSNELVLDLVHPSLWPLVYGTSRQLKKELGLKEALAHIGSGETVPVPTSNDLGLNEAQNGRLWSEKFQWLPAEVSFGSDGKGPARISSYINNAHPIEHQALYPVIEKLIDLSLPMMNAAYERVMTWSELTLPSGRPTNRKRIRCDESNRSCNTPDHCGTYCNSYSMPAEAIPEGIEEDDDDYYDAAHEWFNENHPIAQPEPEEYQFGGVKEFQAQGPWFPTALRRPVGPLSDEEKEKEQEDKKQQTEMTSKWWKMSAEEKAAARDESEKKLAEAAAAAAAQDKDNRLQFIVKLANIHLTPEKPRYDGGSWHFEGQINEHICATSLFYYDCENVTESRLAFRTIVDEEGYTEGGFEYEQGDHLPFEKLYGVAPSDDEPTLQSLGSVVTKQNRLVVFPNVLQHQVQPFELADKTKPGHRKIVALFLVDPNVRVPSTATVPPQQRHWRQVSAVDSRVPPEISEMIYQHVDVPYGLDRAKKLRAELIDERKAIDKTVDTLMNYKTWCFCEH